MITFIAMAFTHNTNTTIIHILCTARSELWYFYWHCNIIMFMSLTTFSNRSQSTRVFIMSSTKHVKLHAKSKPTFTIACKIMIVIMYEKSNCTLQVLNPIKTNNWNRIFNGRAKLRCLTLLFKLLLSVSLSNSLLLAPPSKLCSQTFLIFLASEVFVSAS